MNHNNSSSVHHLPTLHKQQYHEEFEAIRNPIQTANVSIRNHQVASEEVSLLKLIFDCASILLVMSTWLIFKFLIKPVRRPFLCSDVNLYHPEPAGSTIPTWILFLCAVVLPLVIILISEAFREYYQRCHKTTRFSFKIRISLNSYDLPGWVGNLYNVIGVFIFAHGVNSFLTNVGKVSVGRHRPHFVPSCFNHYNYRDLCIDAAQWIVNYTCVGESNGTMKEKSGAFDIRESFPSGHASTAFCGLWFLALYIEHGWNYRRIGLLRSMLQMMCFSLATYIGITRVTDNRHHVTDVLSGAIVGIVIATIAFRYLVTLSESSFSIDVNEKQSINERRTRT